MNEVKRRKKDVRYEPNVPRCSICQHFRKRHLKLINSLPIVIPDWCSRGDFAVLPMGCCDKWQDKNTGQVVE